MDQVAGGHWRIALPSKLRQFTQCLLTEGFELSNDFGRIAKLSDFGDESLGIRFFDMADEIFNLWQKA